MKRETMEWLKRLCIGASADAPMSLDERAAADILAELARLRRIERAARRVDDDGRSSEELHEVLKKGGRK